jgi:nucleotide-binding universal stress UspA family protein
MHIACLTLTRGCPWPRPSVAVNIRSMTTSSLTGNRETAALARARVEAERSVVRLERAVSRLAANAPVDRSAPAGPSKAALEAESSRSPSDATREPARWIVVGYDGSESATRALARAADVAGPRGTVVILTTEPQAYSNGSNPEPLIETGDDPSRLLEDARGLVAAHAPAADVVIVSRKGDPAEHLLDVARAIGAELIVIGRRGKSFVARTLLGSVATGVVGRAPCDVLVVA